MIFGLTNMKNFQKILWKSIGIITFFDSSHIEKSKEKNVPPIHQQDKYDSFVDQHLHNGQVKSTNSSQVLYLPVWYIE